jgi:hypothetical protein
LKVNVAALELLTNAAALELLTNTAALDLETDVSQDISKLERYLAD